MNKRKGMPFSLLDRKSRKNAHFSDEKRGRKCPIDRQVRRIESANADLLAFQAIFCVMAAGGYFG